MLSAPKAAALAAASASNKQRAAAEEVISRAVSDALHLLGLLKGCLGLMSQSVRVSSSGGDETWGVVGKGH